MNIGLDRGMILLKQYFFFFLYFDSLIKADTAIIYVWTYCSLSLILW